MKSGNGMMKHKADTTVIDWDYMTIEKGSFDIWIDHCTFYKAYDGVIDIKTPTDSSNVTISWCEFLPASEDNVFFDAMMNIMKDNRIIIHIISICLKRE